MPRFILCVLLAVLLSFFTFACNSSDDETSTADGDADVSSDGDEELAETEAEEALEMPIGLCNSPAYELLPSDQVGHLVEYESFLLWDLTAKSVDGLLEQAGYTGLSPVPYGATLYRYRYTTQDRGQLVEATSILGVPRSEEAITGPMDIVLQPHGTSGFSDPCAPSRDELEGPALAGLMTSLGFVSFSPDYIGMNGFGDASTVPHAYMVGEQVALASWDAVRAGLELFEELDTGIEVTSRVVPWGGSQGGHSAFFIDRYQPYYAPEFEIPAMLPLIAPVDLFPLMTYAAEDIRPGTGNLAVMLAANNLWYGEQADLNDIFTNEEPYFFADKIYDYMYPKEECEIENIEGDNVLDLYTEKFVNDVMAEDWESLEPWSCYLREGSLNLSSIPFVRSVPTLVSYGELDTLVYTPPMRDGILDLCEMGYQIEYIECQGAEHTQGALWSMPEQYAWLKDRLAGVPMDSEKICVISEPVCCSASEEGACWE